MTHRFISALACALLLLVAQQSAFVHAAWHANEQAPVHQKNKGDASFQGKFCGLHGAFGQVLGGAEPQTHPLPVSECLREAIEYRDFAPVVLELHVPLSRGPPFSA